VNVLAKTRPGAIFVDKSETPGEVKFFKDGQFIGPPTISKSRPLSIKVSNYISLSGGITIT
jgi:hypothetical protein